MKTAKLNQSIKRELAGLGTILIGLGMNFDGTASPWMTPDIVWAGPPN